MSESLTFIRMRERKYIVKVQCSVQYTLLLLYLFNVGNDLLCVIYQSDFTVVVYVTRISRYTMYIASYFQFL
jgi:hypothetical protein